MPPRSHIQWRPLYAPALSAPCPAHLPESAATPMNCRHPLLCKSHSPQQHRSAAYVLMQTALHKLLLPSTRHSGFEGPRYLPEQMLWLPGQKRKTFTPAMERITDDLGGYHIHHSTVPHLKLFFVKRIVQAPSSYIGSAPNIQSPEGSL